MCSAPTLLTGSVSPETYGSIVSDLQGSVEAENSREVFTSGKAGNKIKRYAPSHNAGSIIEFNYLQMSSIHLTL